MFNMGGKVLLIWKYFLFFSRYIQKSVTFGTKC